MSEKKLADIIDLAAVRKAREYKGSSEASILSWSSLAPHTVLGTPVNLNLYCNLCGKTWVSGAQAGAPGKFYCPTPGCDGVFEIHEATEEGGPDDA